MKTLAIAALCLAGASSAARADALPAPIADYGRLVAQVRAAPRPAPIESLFWSAMRTWAWLEQPAEVDTTRTRLAALDDSALAAVARSAPGLRIEKEESTETLFQERSVDWDLEFFLELAKERGDEADEEFFTRMVAENTGDSELPDWVNDVTEMSGCMKFGDGAIVGVYAPWAHLQTRHPGRYAAFVEEEMKLFRIAFLETDCACGDRASVIRELRQLVREFPQADIAPKVRARLAGIESGKIKIREHCQSE